MARNMMKLTPKGVSKVSTAGYYADGAGLYLQVSSTAAKSWIFRYTLSGRSREMGLGSERTFTLAEARSKAADCRKLLASRIDPIEARDSDHARTLLQSAKTRTFTDCATAYIKSHRAGWKNAKHAAQWENTIATYCNPVFGSLSVQDVDTGLVLKVLEPDMGQEA